MQNERLQHLLERYYYKTASPVEREELFTYIENNACEEQVMQFIEATYTSGTPGSMPAAAAKATLDAVMSLTHLPVMDRKPTRRLVHYRWWAAAVLVCLLAGGSYFLSRRTANRADIAVHSSTTDLPPGSNKAQLTLADGSVVQLDSTTSQTIQQGHALVQQTKQGLLYKAADKVAAVGMNKLTTPKGGQFQVQLSDGTQVWLNAASSLTYPAVFTGTDRVVEITGEAYFEVAANAASPFRVKVGHKAAVDVLGTHFNINAYDDEATIQTTLLEGAVRVQAGNKATLLAPGQQAQVDHNLQTRLVPDADVAQAVAWKNGAFSFRNASFPTVMRQLARWYDVEVVYEGEAPAGLFNGEIGRTLTLSQVLEGLAASKIHYRLSDNHKIIIYP